MKKLLIFLVTFLYFIINVNFVFSADPKPYNDTDGKRYICTPTKCEDFAINGEAPGLWKKDSRAKSIGSMCQTISIHDNIPELNCGFDNSDNCCYSEPVEKVIKEEDVKTSQPITFKPEVGFPGFDSEIIIDASSFGFFIFSIFKYLIYLSAIVAVIVITFSGFQWVSAGGNPSKISDAKNRIISALTGLFLCFASILILGTINPDLINIKPLVLENISRIEDYADPVQATTEAMGEIGSLVSIPNYPGIVPTSEKAAPSTIAKIKVAANCMQKKGLSIYVSDSFRWQKDQVRLYNQICAKNDQKNNACVPGCDSVCCPFGGNKICPHSTGKALDLYVRDFNGGLPKNMFHNLYYQYILQDCMYSAGFCNWAGECWHFESSPMSKPCNTSGHNFTRCSKWTNKK